jgi:hypothetical protein
MHFESFNIVQGHALAIFTPGGDTGNYEPINSLDPPIFTV